MENISLYNKLSLLPDQMKSEAADFIDFLLTKAKKEKKAVGKPMPKFGSCKGMFIIGSDFDEPQGDFKNYT